MALIPAGAPHADINGRSPGTERLQSQWLGGRRKSRLAWAWTTRLEATIPKVESSARYWPGRRTPPQPRLAQRMDVPIPTEVLHGRQAAALPL